MRRLGILCIALVITLGTFGVGYATWSDNVTVEETVYSGTLEIELTGRPGCDLGDTCEGATCCGASIASGETLPTLSVDINDAPPSCSGNITFTILNVATIPAMITKVEFIAAPGDDPIELEPGTWYDFDLIDDSRADLSLHLQPGLIGYQFDPPEVNPANTTVAGEINFHVEAGASDNLTTQFDLKFEAVPWNKP